MIASLTVDVEPDCPPYLSTWRGITEGLPRLLDLLEQEHVAATFFVTGETARRFPESVRAIVRRGHEIGCHGDSHRSFSALDAAEGRAEIAQATDALRALCPAGKLVAFRAPYLELPRAFLPVLQEHGYRVDSSLGRHKSLSAAVECVGGLVRVPASITSSTLRWPAAVRNLLLGRLREPAVLFVHPWEFVDFRHSNLRWDCRVRTGLAAEDCLRTAIACLRDRGSTFTTLGSLAAVFNREGRL